MKLKCLPLEGGSRRRCSHCVILKIECVTDVLDHRRPKSNRLGLLVSQPVYHLGTFNPPDATALGEPPPTDLPPFSPPNGSQNDIGASILDPDSFPYSLQRYLTSVSPFEREHQHPITHHTYDHGAGWLSQELSRFLPKIQINGVPILDESIRMESQWIALAQFDPSLSDPDWLVAEILDLNNLGFDKVREWTSGNGVRNEGLTGTWGNANEHNSS
jgi:hypothetical protein